MSLVPLHTATIRIPELQTVSDRIAKNRVVQVAVEEHTQTVEVFVHDKRSYLLRSSSGEEYCLLLAYSKATPPKALPVLKAKADVDSYLDLDVDSKLTWESHPAQSGPTDVISILSCWRGRFSFKEEDEDTPGLRPPQLGAIHAVAAHWATSHAPATVVMPTGTGKTETMLSVLVYCQCPRVLVLVPSDTLRKQLFGKFTTLGCLPDVHAIPEGTPRPVVALLRHSVKDPAEVAQLAQRANVIIATPSVLKAFPEAALRRLTDACTHLFVDEAHHIKAPTWNSIKDRFRNRPVLQFTATPFRQDGQNLEGHVIFNYPLGKAQGDGYFRHIEMISIEEFEQSASDRAIARQAVDTLDSALDSGLDHLVMAKTSSITRAEEILRLYQKLGARHNPMLVHSRMGRGERDAVLEAITRRSSRIVVCVDMLGEGFDLPNLKIAAMHDIHRSLAITLQFIGRFTRTATNVGDATVIVDTGDPRVQRELEALYAENADWNHLIRYQSETRIRKEIALQELVDSLRSGSLSQQISLWNLRPASSALFYRTDCTAWAPTGYAQVLPEDWEKWHAVSHSHNMLVVVVAKQEPVSWGDYKSLKDCTFELLVAHWDKDNDVLALHCSDYDSFRCGRLADALCGGSCRPITGTRVFRVLSNVQRPMVRNLGASKSGTIRFTMYFGPDVAVGLSQVEQAQSDLNNIFGWGFEDGEKVTWGCSARKGKVWSRGGGPVTEWRDWCARAYAKISDDSIANLELLKGFLRPEEIQDRPDLVPITVDWGQGLQVEHEQRVSIFFGDDERRLIDVDLSVGSHAENGPLTFRMTCGELESLYELIIDPDAKGGYAYRLVSGSEVAVKRGRKPLTPLTDFMATDPVIIYYSDGSFSYNNFLVQVAPTDALFDQDSLIPLDWHGTDIRCESQGQEVRVESIQHRAIQEIIDEFEVVFDDDGPGEAADVIALRQDGVDRLHACLIHCKYSGADSPGARVDDFYAVCGQAQKCIRWKHAGMRHLVEHMEARETRWHEKGFSRFVKGTHRDLARLRRFARKARTTLEVAIVQPGLAKGRVSTPILSLLGGTELFLKETADAELRVFCSG